MHKMMINRNHYRAIIQLHYTQSQQEGGDEINHYVQVKCLVNRYWDPATKDWGGQETTGTLIDISAQTCESDPSRTIPVGIVVLEDCTFEAVPMQFINAHLGNNN